MIVWRCIVVLFLRRGGRLGVRHGYGWVQLDLFLLLLLGHTLTKSVLNFRFLFLLPLEFFFHPSLLLLLLLEQTLFLLLQLSLFLLDLFKFTLLFLKFSLPLRLLFFIKGWLDPSCLLQLPPSASHQSPHLAPYHILPPAPTPTPSNQSPCNSP